MWYIHTVEYYSTIKKFELLLHITTWMNLENIMESERSQLEKITYSVIPIIWNVQDGEIQRDQVD